MNYKFIKKTVLVSTFTLLLLSTTVNAWVYPEHREIALRAIQNLSPAYREALTKIWLEARKGHESRLSESVIDTSLTVNPGYLDYAAWPAIAGDHSFSAENLLEVVLYSDWILKVADITARLKIDLAHADTREDRINALRNSDLQLQSADPEYATRAGSNNVHFLLPLHNVDQDLDAYIDSCLTEGAEINAVGAYYIFHNSALIKASHLADIALTENERSRLAISALADEAFAQHFLEDMFAAGHAAGTWGFVSQRKGTHDYYNEHGLKVTTWEGEKSVLVGDAWMREEDAGRASAAVKLSLEQILDAASAQNDRKIKRRAELDIKPNSFNVSRINSINNLDLTPDELIPLKEVMLKTPVPGLKKGLGHLPRFRTEIGTFAGFSPSVKGSMIFGGFAEPQNTLGLTGGIEAAVRFGVGLDGVLNEAGDGLIFLELGWRQDGSSTTGIIDAPDIEQYGSIFAAIPGRSAYSARFRLPFYIVPLDLLIAGPFLLLFDRDALTNMAATAVNGGLIPWQVGIATSFGRFQFVLGREVSVYFYGKTRSRDAIMTYVPLDDGSSQLILLSYKSTLFEFPILEYRPFRSYSEDQRSSMLIQLYGGFDIPYDFKTFAPPDGPAANLQTVWFIGSRLVFDWRHYF